MSNIIGFSKGLYSSWFYHAPSRSLFDCGEGCASYLGNKVHAVQNIFISHDHNDHVAGLFTFIAIRHSGLVSKVKDEDGEDVNKPLKIYYPLGNTNIWEIQTYIKCTFPTLNFKLEWYGIDEVMRPLPNGVHAFRTFHYRKMSLGYKIVEIRKRLKKEYVGQDIPALLRSKSVDRADLMQEYAANTLVYTLDSRADYKFDDIKDADLWIADTTFLSTADRTGGNTHASMEEILPIAATAGVKNLVLAHISPRYSIPEVRSVVDWCVEEYPAINIKWVDYTRTFNL